MHANWNVYIEYVFQIIRMEKTWLLYAGNFLRYKRILNKSVEFYLIELRSEIV